MTVRCSKRETPEEAMHRRLRESQRVEERVIQVRDLKEFRNQVLESKDALVVVEVTSDEVCDTGLEEEVEMHWRADQRQKENELMQICGEIKHVFQRTARECKDVKFVAVDSDTKNGAKLADELDVDTIPTLQFYRGGQLLWEHKGVVQLQKDLGEGVLYYANTYAGGADASDFVFQIKSKEDFENFIQQGDNEKILKVIDVSVESADPCIRVYPAVLALAKNFQGYVSFARLLVDDPNLVSLKEELNVIDVPLFLFYQNGKEVQRYASSSRADLIGHILSIQGMNGLPPPPRRTRRMRRSQPAAQR